MFSFLENKLYDSRIKVTAPFCTPDDDICFIAVDQESINKALSENGWTWPWPREAYAKIIDFLTEGGVKSICMDVLFTEPSVYGFADDEIFEKACKKSGKVIQTHLFSNGIDMLPIQQIKSSSALIGNINGISDEDGIIRRANLSFARENEKIPALGIASLVLNNDIELKDLEQSVLLHYKGDINRYAHYSAWEIIESYSTMKNGKQPWVEPENFENSHVFLLFYAPGLYDICATPVSKTYPGGGVHITLLDNYINNDFINKVSSIIIVVLILCFSLFASFLVLYLDKIFMKISNYLMLVSAILFLCLYFGISYFLFAKTIFIEIMPPSFSFSISFLLCVLMNYSMEGKRRRFIQTAFGQYLSPKVIDKLIENPDSLKLGGEKKHLSIMFSDIQSFTTISESMSPEKLTELLNLYLSEMTKIIIQSGGTVDKYIGDAIVAFWNAPVEIENHASVAVGAGLLYQEKLLELNKKIKNLYGVQINARIGLNTGDAVVGNMGSDLRFDYSMFGDAVNLASRLEGLNKQFGTHFMCSEQTKNEAEINLRDVYFRTLGKIVVVGKSQPITIYEPLTIKNYNLNSDFFDAFEKAVSFFYDGEFELAYNIFDLYKEQDKTCRNYIEKCRFFIENPDLWVGYLISDKK